MGHLGAIAIRRLICALVGHSSYVVIDEVRPRRLLVGVPHGLVTADVMLEVKRQHWCCRRCESDFRREPATSLLRHFR